MTSETPVDLSGINLVDVPIDPSGSLVDPSGNALESPKVAKKDMPLYDIIKEYLGKESKEIVLSPRVIHMFNRLLQLDTTNLENIEKLFNKIMEDKKVNAKDTPAIVLVVKELYRFFKQLFIRKVVPADCGLILKTIIYLLLTYRYDEDPETKEAVKDEIFNVLDSVIGSCIDLIEFKEKIPKGLFKHLLVCF